ncbi:MAG: tRNA pseudouridine(38-40) synthase TruA [Ignavibacteriae bacterium]|nr:MAG: tRNA pseudouridine(38-40) synthase TruA [Ignavibacteriota bacterium]
MPTIRLLIEYDGTEYSGWQFQTNGRSIQEEIEKAIKQILQSELRITGAGRTDAGVHARGQVASFFIEKDVEVYGLAKSLSAVLPKSIVIKEAAEAPRGFNARFDATQRRYSYSISRVPTAIHRNYCWELYQELHVELMQQCAKEIYGEHGFRAFCKVQDDFYGHRCTVTCAEWVEHKSMLNFEITANRFLHGMVRTLVGTMVNVGRGHTALDDFVPILESKERAAAGMSAPAKGLVLEEIYY